MKACKIWLVATSRKLTGSVTQATAYLKERWSILSQSIGSRERVSNPSCHPEWFCYFAQIIAFLSLSFPIPRTRKMISVCLFHGFFHHGNISGGEAQREGSCPALVSLKPLDGVWSGAEGLCQGFDQSGISLFMFRKHFEAQRGSTVEVPSSITDG